MTRHTFSLSLKISIGIILLLIILPTVILMLTHTSAPVQRSMPKPVTTLLVQGGLDIGVCDPSEGPFYLDITNEYLPFPVGMVHVMEDATTKVQISVLDTTETIEGVSTRVVEEREWENGDLIESSRNYFAQAPDGTVCYFGEDVDIYEDGKITKHDGSWRAGGQNRPGIAMPAHPIRGQKYQMEVAPGVAMDVAEHKAIHQSLKTPAGVFDDVLVVDEIPASPKQYQRGVGLIYDHGSVLTAY